jgi:hypothetical protein
MTGPIRLAYTRAPDLNPLSMSAAVATPQNLGRVTIDPASCNDAARLPDLYTPSPFG